MKALIFIFSAFLSVSCERPNPSVNQSKSDDSTKPAVSFEKVLADDLIKKDYDKGRVVSILGKPDRTRVFKDSLEQWDYYVPIDKLKNGRNVSGLSVAFRNGLVMGVMPQYTTVGE